MALTLQAAPADTQRGGTLNSLMPTQAEPRWQLRLLGAIEATAMALGGQAPIRWPSRAVVTLLARLALAPDRAHPREELVNLLWSDVALAVGRNRLRQALSTRKAQLEPPGAYVAAVLQADRSAIRLRPGTVDCDVLRFEAALHDASRVQRSDGAAPSTRRALLQPVREFAAERCAPADTRQARQWLIGFAAEALAHARRLLVQPLDERRRSLALVRWVWAMSYAGHHDSALDPALAEAATLARRCGDRVALANALRIQGLRRLTAAAALVLLSQGAQAQLAYTLSAAAEGFVPFLVHV